MFCFGGATGQYIVYLFLEFKESKNKQKFTLLWDALPTFHLITLMFNSKIWCLLDTKLKEMRHNGLLPFTNSKIHIMNNAFHKDIVAVGQDVEGLAFNSQGMVQALTVQGGRF